MKQTDTSRSRETELKERHPANIGQEIIKVVDREIKKKATLIAGFEGYNAGFNEGKRKALADVENKINQIPREWFIECETESEVEVILKELKSSLQELSK